MSEQHSNCPCPEQRFIPINGFKVEGLSVALDADSLPGGVEPGPDNTHLVSRDGALAWDPIAPGADGVSYSTEEQWTGKLWIDGKKIYQKTVDCGPMPNQTTTYVDTNVSSIETLVALWGMCLNDSYALTLPRTSPVAAHQADVLCKIDDDPARLRFDISYLPAFANFTRSFITIQYTCSDR